MAPEKVSKTAAVSPQVYYPTNYAQQYANLAMGVDATDDTFMGLNALGGAGYISNPYSMDSSIFGGGYGMGGFGMGGYGYNQELMNMSPKERMAYMNEMEDLQIQRQVDRKKVYDRAQVSADIEDDATTRQVGNLQRIVEENEQDHVMAEYGKLVTTVQKRYGCSHEQAKVIAEKYYYQATGKSLLTDLEEKGDSPFVHGLKQGAFGFGWLLTNKKNYKENMCAITGEEETKSDKIWKAVGFGVSTILTGGLVLLGATKGIKALRGARA